MEEPKRAPYLFVSPVKFSVVEEAQTLLTLEGGAEILHPNSVSKALIAFKAAGRGVLVISASEAAHLKIVANIAARLAPQLRLGIAKILVISPLAHPSLPKLLKKYQCEEQVPITVNPKGLKIKLQRCLSLVEIEKQPSAAGGAASATARSKVSSAGKSGNEVIDTSALKIANDCWLLRTKGPRKVQGHWIVQLMGPGPRAGRWVKTDDRKGAWLWLPQDPTNNPFVREGQWTFHGKQPEFREMMWTFIGENVLLQYTRGGKEEARRFYVDSSGNLILPRNSEAAKSKIPEIQGSIDLELRIPVNPVTGTEMTYEPAFELEDTGSGLEADLEMELDMGLGKKTNPHADRPDVSPNTAKSEVPELLGGVFGDNQPVDPARLKFYRNAKVELAPRPGLFDPVSDPRKRESYMSESAAESRKATIWTRAQEFRSEAKILAYTPSSGLLLLAYPEGLNQKKFTSRLGDVGAEELLVNANLNRAALFFRQSLSEITFLKSGFELQSPAILFEVQRRAHFRFAIPEDRPFKVRLEGVPGLKGAIEVFAGDMSAGGACLKLDPKLSVLKKGAKIGQVEFKIYNQLIRCTAEVRWVTPTHLGIQFSGIDPYKVEGIKLFIMEESYQYLSKYLIK